MISVLIPAYNEEGNVERTAAAVGSTMDKNNIDYEIVFVNDGSADKTWEKMKTLAKADSHGTQVFMEAHGRRTCFYCH